MREESQPRSEGGLEPRSEGGLGERSDRGAHRALAELAASQHGVVSIRQLLGPLGYSRGAVSRACAAGRLQRVYRGVYAVGHAALSLHGRCLAAMLAGGSGALLSHRSAAWLWELTRASPAPFSVTVDSPRRARLPIVVHRARDLRAADRALVDNIPVTALPRTLLDYAAAVRHPPLRRAIERAEERQLFDLAAVDELLGRTAGHPGHGRLRRALELYRPAPFTRSGLERRFLELVEAAGLPRPLTGFNLGGHELDAYWPAQALVVELDVYETHGSREAFERDRLRQEDLLLEDLRVTRVTGRRLDREPRRVIERVARLLARGEQRRPGLPASGRRGA